MQIHKLLAIPLLGFALSIPGYADARGGHSGGGHSYHSHAGVVHVASHSGYHTSRAAYGVPRNNHGRIARSAKAKDEFKRSNHCPSTGRASGACPGYVIDHVMPLKRGGADDPSNMQWQTTAAAKAKDRTE
jgi:hypothetical protein